MLDSITNLQLFTNKIFGELPCVFMWSENVQVVGSTNYNSSWQTEPPPHIGSGTMFVPVVTFTAYSAIADWSIYYLFSGKYGSATEYFNPIPTIHTKYSKFHDYANSLGDYATIGSHMSNVGNWSHSGWALYSNNSGVSSTVLPLTSTNNYHPHYITSGP